MLDASWLPSALVGLKVWDGIYEDYEAKWIRWCDKEGELLPLQREISEKSRLEAKKSKREAEKSKREADAAKRLVEDSRREAEEAKQEAERLKEKLRQLGLSDDTL